MRQIKKVLLALLLLVTVYTVNAQTVDEVVNKYIDALGGKEKLMALNSLKMEGTLTVQGFDVGITVTVLNGKGSRTDISVPGQSDGYRIVTPTKGWNFLPFQGQSAPEEAPDDQLKLGQAALDLQSPLLNYAAKGHKVELLGKEKVDAADCYKIKITYKNGKEATLFIDSNTYYRVKSVTTANVDGQDTNVEITYSDFRKTPDGYVFAYTQTTPNGPITYSSIEINKPVDENIFKVN
jgi:hypothetical protein